MMEPAVWVSSVAGEVMHYILLLATAREHSSLLLEERASTSRLVSKISHLMRAELLIQKVQ